MTERRKELDIEPAVVPKVWEDAVAACLAKDPSRRPQSAAEVAQRLQLAARPTSTGTAPGKVSTKGLLVGGIAALSILALAGLYFGAFKRQAKPLSEAAAIPEKSIAVLPFENRSEEKANASDLEDHDLLYASPKTLRNFDFLRKKPLASIPWEQEAPSSALAKLRCLADHFRTTNTDFLYFNLTSPDLHEFGVYAARVIIPGFQPIDFGWKERRLGGERLYQLPQRLGLRSHRQTLEELNPEPHPIS